MTKIECQPEGAKIELIQEARQAFLAVFEKAPTERAFPLINAAVTEMFIEAMAAASDVPKLVALVNSLLKPSGCELVTIRH
jgi:hypothetical protein